MIAEKPFSARSLPRYSSSPPGSITTENLPPRAGESRWTSLPRVPMTTRADLAFPRAGPRAASSTAAMPRAKRAVASTKSRFARSSLHRVESVGDLQQARRGGQSGGQFLQ